MNRSLVNTFADQDRLSLTADADYGLERSADGWVAGHFYNCRLSSVFQPVFSLIKKEIIGHAAYIRSESGGEIALSPWDIFTLAAKDAQQVNLDHLSRVVHALNYFKKACKPDKLFLRVHQRLLESDNDDHGRAFENFLNLIDVKTARVVLEIPAAVNRNRELLEHIIINYRSRGYQLAINCTDLSGEWMEALGGLHPDIVRIEASHLAQHDAIALLTATIRSIGATLLVQNVETSEQVTAAMHVETDYLQGNFLGRAARTVEMNAPQLPVEKFNIERYRQKVSSADQRSV